MQGSPLSINQRRGFGHELAMCRHGQVNSGDMY